jgi:hypothetical protein
MSTSVRAHPWWVAAIAVAAAIATIGLLALLGTFDADPAPSKPIPAVVVKATAGKGDTKDDVGAGTSAVGQELAYQAGAAAGAGK